MAANDPHDPGAAAARERADQTSAAGAPVTLGTSLIRLGTAGWTDRTLTAAGVFYPDGAGSAEERLRYYAGRFPLVEVDSTYYALPSRQSAELWVERTPPGFVFDVKAFATMTGHPTEGRRLPKEIRDTLPASLRERTRLYPNDLGDGPINEVWTWFRDAVEPLRAAGKLGSILMQYPPWFHPTRESADAILDARRRLEPVPIAVELRNADWFSGKVGRRTLDFLREEGIGFVMVDEPQGTSHSVPPVTAVTAPGLAIMRFHGRKPGVWDRPGTSVAERFRYLYSRAELAELADRVREAAAEARELHVIFNNCYANYGVTNALELGALLRG